MKLLCLISTILHKGHSRTNVFCWLVASSEHSTHSLWKDTAETGICLLCHCGTYCTGALSYFKTHCRTQEQVLTLCSCSYCSPENSVTKCLRTRPREREGRSANAQKIIGPDVPLVEELTTVHSWQKQFISEKRVFWFWFATMEWLLRRQRFHAKSGINGKNAKVVEWWKRQVKNCMTDFRAHMYTYVEIRDLLLCIFINFWRIGV